MVSGMRQFDRGVRLTVIPPGLPPIIVNPKPPAGPGVVSDPQIHVRFSTDFSMTPEPQRCGVQLINLGRTIRNLLSTTAKRADRLARPGEQAGTLVGINGRLLPADPLVSAQAAGHSYLILEAGYGGWLAKIFEGYCTVPRHRKRGTEWITSLDAGDAELNLQQGTIDVELPAGTPLLAVLQLLVQQGLGLSRIVQSPGTAAILASGGAILRARRFRGVARLGVEEILGAHQILWWVEAGQLMTLAPLEFLPGPPIVCSPVAAPGSIQLVEAPDPIDDGGARIRCLLTPGLLIGRKVEIVSSELSGAYRVEQVQHVGDNRSGVFETRAIVRSLIALGL